MDNKTYFIQEPVFAAVLSGSVFGPYRSAPVCR